MKEKERMCVIGTVKKTRQDDGSQPSIYQSDARKKVWTLYYIMKEIK